MGEYMGGVWHPELATTFLASVPQATDQYDDATFDPAVEIGRSTLGERHAEVATTLHNLAYVHQAKGQHDKAIELYTYALDIERDVLGEWNPKVATTLNNLAYVHQAKGQFDKAIELYTLTLEMQ